MHTYIHNIGSTKNFPKNGHFICLVQMLIRKIEVIFPVKGVPFDRIILWETLPYIAMHNLLNAHVPNNIYTKSAYHLCILL